MAVKIAALKEDNQSVSRAIDAGEGQYFID